MIKKMSSIDGNIANNNLQHQLMQRENNLRYQSDPQLFTRDLYRRRYQIAKNLYKKDLVGHYGCVNAIEFSHGGQFLASGGDDKRVLLWDVEKTLAGVGSARVLDFEHASNIFCLCFDSKNRRLLSGGNDDLVICHDLQTGQLNNVFKQDNPIYGISINPENDDVFAMAGESGKILIYDQRENDTSEPFVVAELRSSFHAVEYHPTDGNLLVTANSKHGAALYDTRKPNQPVIQYVHMKDPLTCMSVRFNRLGNLILGLRRRLPPILYSLQHAEPICTFYHKNYYNSCTMKSCTFAGEDDELVISGSDDFNLYVWRVSDVDLDNLDQWIDSTQMVLYGHRSIVNQVRYNREKCLLASSGVEKIIKMWSPFCQPGWTGDLLQEASCSENPRELFSPFFVNVMTVSSLSHDYSSHNTNEDPRMLAFFDSLIRQEVDGLDSNSSTDSPLETDVNSNSSNFSLASNSFSNSSTTTISTTNTSSGSDDDNNDNDPPRHRKTNQTAAAAATSAAASSSAAAAAAAVVRKRRLKMNGANFDRLVKTNRNLRICQRRKPANRITYVIDRNQRALKLLAVRNVSLIRPYQLLKIVKRRTTTTIAKKRRAYAIMKCRQKQSRKSCRRRAVSGGRGTLCNTNTEWPTTSTAAAGKLSTGVVATGVAAKANKKINRYKSKRNGLSVARIHESSHSNNSPSSGSSSNAVLPSTSTGITTSLRDDILRLRRQQQQIFDSEEDEDDNEDNDNNLGTTTATSDLCLDHLPFKKKKLNGLQKSSTATSTTIKRKRQPVLRSHALRIYRTSADRSNSINGITTITSTTTTNTTPPSSSSSFRKLSTVANERNSSNNHAAVLGTKVTNKKPNNTCHFKSSLTKCDSNLANDSTDDMEYSFNFCLSNSSKCKSNETLTAKNDSISEEASSSSKCENDNLPNDCNNGYNSLSSPSKRRKLSSSNSNRSTTIIQTQFRNTNLDENKKNDVFTIENSRAAELQNTPIKHQICRLSTTSKLKSNQQATSSITTTTTATFAYTPDSGVSMTNFNSPAGGNNGSNDVISSMPAACSSSRVVMRLSPCLEETNNTQPQLFSDGDEGISLLKLATNNDNKSLSPSSSNIIKFRQKIAHVRRNYRKHFAYDDSDDSD